MKEPEKFEVIKTPKIEKELEGHLNNYVQYLLYGIDVNIGDAEFAYKRYVKKINNQDIHYDNSKVISYLRHNGFIKMPTPYTASLTTKGRKLKKLKTLQNFYVYLNKVAYEKFKRTRLEDIILDNQAYLTTEQREIDKRNRIITLCIAITSAIISIASPFITYYLATNEPQKEMILKQPVQIEIKRQANDTNVILLDKSAKKALGME